MGKKAKGQEVFVSGAEEYISRIRNKYDQMSEAERHLANYFLEHEYDPDMELNIKDIAARASTSIATVVRFCKTIGYKGFSEFKYSVQNGVLAPIGGDLRIGSHDDMSVVKQKVAEFAKRNIVASSQCTDSKELERAVTAVEKCSRILISANGTSSGVALVAVNAFSHVGIPCQFPGDSLTALRTFYLCDKTDLVIGINNCGYQKDVVDGLKVAKDRGATTIGISAVPDSLLNKYSDITLANKLDDHSLALDIITTSVCQMLIIQAIQIAYLARHSNEVAQKMKNVYQLNELARYSLDLESIKNSRITF